MLLMVTPDVDPALLQALDGAGLRPRPFEPALVEAAVARGAAGANGAAGCAILWGGPEHGLADALRQGLPPGPAIAAWMAGAQALLDAFRPRRRKVLLVDGGALTDEGRAEDRDLLRRKLACPGLQLPLVSGRPKAAETEGQAGDPAGHRLSRMLARLAVARLDDIRDTLEELQASSISPPVAGLDLAALSAMSGDLGRLIALGPELRSLQAFARTVAADHCKAQLEVDRILAQTLADLRAAAQAREDLAAELAEAQQRRKEFWRRTVALQERVAALETQAQDRDARHADELALLRSQVGLHLEEDARAAEARALLHAQREDLAAQLTEAQQRRKEFWRRNVELQQKLKTLTATRKKPAGRAGS